MYTSPRFEVPDLGYGVGLRREHWQDFFGADRGGLTPLAHEVGFFELLSENFMAPGGEPALILERARAHPLVLHGTALSIGSESPLSTDYLRRLRALVERSGAHWFSDHLCFSSAFGVEYHELLPVPLTREALDHVVTRIEQVKREVALPASEALGREIPFLLENPSYYIEYGASELTEGAFIAEMLERADCGLLLDVNNVYVNARNHNQDPYAFIDALPLERVVQIHMAGHSDLGDVIIDTHGEPIVQEVFALYAHVLSKTGPVTTLLEWDTEIPGVERLLEELGQIRAVGEAATSQALPMMEAR
ncbi:MAG: DUF692 domain-containing protein [Bradymonadia bacterium]